MSLSTDPARSPVRYECYLPNIKVQGQKEEQELSSSQADVLCALRSEDSSLRIPALDVSQFLSDRDGSRPCSPLAGQGDSTRRQDVPIHDSRNQNKHPLLSDDGYCQTVADVLHSDGEQENERKLKSKTKVEETSAKSARPLTEEEKIRERSRKGRERSLRTRRRNMARLKLLEENCAHYSKENNVLRELARSLSEQDAERAMELFNRYKLLKEEKPEPHKLSQSESYYMNLLSPLSVTASTASRENDSKKPKATEVTLKTEHSLIPCTYKGLPSGHSSEDLRLPHRQEEASTPRVQKSVREVSDVSIAGENNVSSAEVFHSVFADPAYCDEKDIGFALEDLYKQPPLSVEEILGLLEEGRNLVELPQL